MKIPRFSCVLALVVSFVVVSGRGLAAEPTTGPAAGPKPEPPALDKAWGLEEYVAFYKYMGKLSPDAYPRMDDPASRPLFKKLVVSFEVEALKNPELAVATRLQMSGQMLQVMSMTLLAYASAFNQGNDYSLEVIHLQGGTLALTRQVIEAMDKFVPGLDPNAADYEARMAGLTKAKRGMAMEIDGALTSVTETHAYSDEERQVLCQYLLANGPAIVGCLEAADRQEAVNTTKATIKKEKNAEVKALLEKFVSAVSPAASDKAGREPAE